MRGCEKKFQVKKEIFLRKKLDEKVFMLLRDYHEGFEEILGNQVNWD